MLVAISPAKRLDWTARQVPTTRPVFQDDAQALARVARRLSAGDLQRSMRISPDLARLARDRFAAFSEAPELADTRPAALAFAGNTYLGLEAATLDADEADRAQRHLRILSGLYGLLRPSDAIQPYRLEMGTRLRTRRGATLYDWWGDRLAQALSADAARAGTDIVVNCASVEYFRAADRPALALRVIAPVFLDDRGDGPKILAVHAKRARGAMARFIVQNRLTDPAALTGFDAGGYRHCRDLSRPDRPAFLRMAEVENTGSALTAY